MRQINEFGIVYLEGAGTVRVSERLSIGIIHTTAVTQTLLPALAASSPALALIIRTRFEIDRLHTDPATAALASTAGAVWAEAISAPARLRAKAAANTPQKNFWLAS